MKSFIIVRGSIVLLLLAMLAYSCQSKEDKKEPLLIEKEIKKDSLPSVPDSGIRVYLTFDDGPYYTTLGLTDCLKKLKVKASFFIVGSQVAHSRFYDSIFRDTKNEPNFKIYNHTFSHAITKGRFLSYYQNPSTVWADITKNKSIINTGGNITRLPGMNTWRIGQKRVIADRKTRRLIQLLDSTQQHENFFGWDVEWRMKHSMDRSAVDSMYNTIKKLTDRDTARIKNIVLLSHDFLYKSPESLENLTYFVQKLQQELHCTFHWAEEMDGLFPSGQ